MQVKQLESGVLLASYETARPVMGLRSWMSTAERDEYRKQHAVCPACGEYDHCVTTAGVIGPPDTNKVSCACGWVGIVDDLVAAKAR